MGKIKTYILLSILTVMAVINVSCVEEHHYYQDPLWGRWILIADELGPIDPAYAEVYTFGADGYGSLDWFDEWGRNYVDDFSWSGGPDFIDIYYYNGGAESYYFYFHNGNLILWDGYNSFRYREYARY